MVPLHAPVAPSSILPKLKVIFGDEINKNDKLSKCTSIVDEVIIYQDVDKILPTIDFDIFVIGEDQTHSGFQKAVKWCEEKGREVIRLPRTPGICSSSIKLQVELLK